MIDRINLDILRCHTRSRVCKASEISHKVNLSVSAVIERIHRMEAAGIIRQYTVILDPKQVGNDLTALMEVSLEHPKYYDGLVEMIRQHPNVAECHYLTGEFDFLLKIITDSSASLERSIAPSRACPASRPQKPISSSNHQGRIRRAARPARIGPAADTRKKRVDISVYPLF